MLFLAVLLIGITRVNVVEPRNLYKVTLTQPLVELNLENANIFKHELSSDFSNLLLIDESLYLTGNDYVFCLNSSDIACSEAYCGYKEKHIKPTTIHASGHNNVNFVKFLAYRENIADFIVCCTNKGSSRKE